MSDIPVQPSLAKQLAGRWQIPLLVISLAGLGVGIWRLRPETKPPRFEQVYAHAVTLKDLALYTEASDFIKQQMVAPERTGEELRRFHGLMAQVIFAHEVDNAVHSETNARRIIENSDKALVQGESGDAQLHEMRAKAYEWLQKPAEAVTEYQKAVSRDGDSEHSWEIRKRMIEIQRSTDKIKPEELHQAYDKFLADAGLSEELRYWAAEQKVELFESQDKHADAERFLSEHADEFRDPIWQKAYQFLQALSWYRTQRLDDAERLLRTLSAQTSPGEALYARCGWLLGKVLQTQDSPEVALSFFNDILLSTSGSPYRTACLLGKAESLAALERFDESIAAYKETLRRSAEDPYGSLVDLQVVRESTASLYQSLLVQGKLAEAMEYLRIAAKLVPPTDEESKVIYAERLGDLSLALGKAALRDAGELDDASQTEAKQAFRDAGEFYLDLARLVSNEDAAAASAIWRAADAFDLAGQRSKTAEVLEEFLLDQPESPRAPMAFLRLGQTYQAIGEYEKAVARYQDNLTRFPRTPSAVACLVPLSECYLALKQPEKAESVLLRIVVHQMDDPLALIEPEAAEYRDALFGLGDLYARAGEYEKSIARYEEAIQRYPNDARTDRAAFLLADIYRRSAARIRDDLNDQKNLPFKDELRATHQKRLERSRELFAKVIERFHERDVDSLQELDRLYLKLSHFYQADAVYDQSKLSGQPELRIFSEAVELYDRAAWLYQKEPMAMTAYIQMIHCYLRLGSPEKARMALQRARWAIKGIPDERFVEYGSQEDRTYWENYLSWLEKTPMLGADAAQTG